MERAISTSMTSGIFDRNRNPIPRVKHSLGEQSQQLDDSRTHERAQEHSVAVQAVCSWRQT